MHLPNAITSSRRQTVGLALLSIAGVHQAANTQAKSKKNRKKKEQCDRRVEQGIVETCGRQFAPCVSSVSQACERHRDPQVCLAQVNECCSLVGRCELQAYLTCISLVFEPSEPP